VGRPQVEPRAVFLDRDGVLNQPIIQDGKPYPPERVSDFALYPDAVEGCDRLHSAGFLLVVVTNQPDVGRGTQTREAVEEMHRELKRSIPSLDRIEVCYHGGSEHAQPCTCRKPKPGMIIRAAQDLNINPMASYVIGDRWRDIDCAHAAGCRSVFIDRGYRESLREKPHFTVANFFAAVDAVLRDAFGAVSSREASASKSLPS
jgi:D-glycero-D-manno-heptose 1,7-bisphosphate phosphatase